MFSLQNKIIVAAIAGMFLILGGAVILSGQSMAEPFNQGPKKCAECHKAEFQIWEETKHAKSFKKVHKSKLAKALAKATGNKSMKKNETCVQCHYTLVAKDAASAAKAKPKAGPSCESCHGASSDWFTIHNNRAEPKDERIVAATAAGMRWSFDRYGIAENCNECHGLANANIDPEKLAIMLENGHPAKPDWEYVKYSQGSIRHRFYPPDMTKNAEMTPAEMSRAFVVGQAAKLVSATIAISRSGSPKFIEFQQARAEAARAALSGVDAAKTLIENPNRENAVALTAAIKDQDLSGTVGGLLPTEFK
ncbi:MAG: hypothetical protein CMM30_01175 [Rhodospirillaceae bacterium]|nr:hypothetical protein [Alphaproteobacteria bacterium]MBR71538.1 hypothetical protein [Rhodospirillaceae bacterium]|tara:strand:- start:1840 stop:2760 length:921 start_codon:yes stop_codon:yes gene_type:complete